MQMRFDMGRGADLGRWQAALAPLIADRGVRSRRSPIGEFVKALISSRTRDAVSLAAYGRLVEAYGTPARLAGAVPAAIERAIAPVTFADAKARNLAGGLRRMRAEGIDLRLDFLGPWPLPRALGWLERFDGVGRKVAASVLNASTLDRPVFIVDTHVLRVLRRLGFVDPTDDYRAASEAVTAAAVGWSGEALLRLHDAMKRLGQELCRHDGADCARCPLAADCLHARRRT